MGQSWAYFRSLAGWERWFFLQAFCGLPLTHWAIRWLGFSRVCHWLTRWSGQQQSTVPTERIPVLLARNEHSLYWAAHYGLHPGNCLSRALLLWWLLQRQGVRSELRIGVRRQDGKFEAHAWIEYNGQPVSEVANVRQHYAAFPAELFATLSHQS